MGTYTRWLTKTLLLGIALAVVAICVQITANADTSSPWQSGTPAYQQTGYFGIYSVDDINAYSAIKNSRMGCTKQDFITRPKRNAQTENKIPICSYDVLGGQVASELLLKNGPTIAGALKGSTNTNSIIKPIPNSDTVIELTSAQGLGYNIWPLDNAYVRAKQTTDNTGVITYALPAAAVGTNIKNANNQPVLADPNTVGFSDNGQWMIADAPGTGFVRINITNHAVLPFTASLTAAYGRSVPTINAISGDGRYAVVTSSNTPNLFTLYDLDTCTAPATGSVVYSCQSRDLQSFMASKIPTYRKVIGNIRFISNDTVQFYADYDFISGINRKYGLFTLTTPNITPSRLDYLALGDSFSSGEGIFSYLPATDLIDNRCHIATKSYPYILYQNISSVGSFKSIACSGAKTKDIVTDDEPTYNKDDSQAFNKITNGFDDEIYSNYLPGYRVQQHFVKNNIPSIITMSMGGNDIGFSSILKKCVLSIDSCYQYYQESAELVTNINAVYKPLLNTYQKIKASAAPQARIYIVGYPQIAEPGGNCGVNVRFNNIEILFGQELIKQLNTVVKTAADHAGVAYIDVEHAFDGHKLCETTEKNIAINGLTAASQEDILNKKPAAAESYHPNALGHILLASAINTATAGFTLPMPVASTSAVNFGDVSLNTLVFGKPSSGNALYATTYNGGMTADTLLQNDTSNISLSTYDYSFKPNTSYSLVMYSDLTSLGTVTSDTYGNIDTTFTVPSTLAPGYHTLHLRGVNVQDEPVDIMKIVYIAANAEDFDGDGILNNAEACLLGEPANIDYDQDGIDDACDGAISEPPVVVPPPVVITPPVEEPPVIVVIEPPVEVIAPGITPPTYETPPPATPPTDPPVQETIDPQTLVGRTKDALAFASAEQTPKETKTAVTVAIITPAVETTTAPTSSPAPAVSSPPTELTVNSPITSVAGVQTTQPQILPKVTKQTTKISFWWFALLIAPITLATWRVLGRKP